MLCDNCSYTGTTRIYKTGKDKHARLCEDCADGWGFKEWDDAEDDSISIGDLKVPVTDQNMFLSILKAQIELEEERECSNPYVLEAARRYLKLTFKQGDKNE
jgi:NMD protein affecting ribosome stability and mRNA decay